MYFKYVKYTSSLKSSMSFPWLIFFFKLKYDKEASQLYTRCRHTGHAQNPPPGSQSWPPAGSLLLSVGVFNSLLSPVLHKGPIIPYLRNDNALPPLLKMAFPIPFSLEKSIIKYRCDTRSKFGARVMLTSS